MNEWWKMVTNWKMHDIIHKKILSALSLIPALPVLPFCIILHLLLSPYYPSLFFKYQVPPTFLWKCQETFYRSNRWKCYFPCLFASGIGGNTFKESKSFICLSASFWTCITEESKKGQTVASEKKIKKISFLSMKYCFMISEQEVWEVKNLHRNLLMLLLWINLAFHQTVKHAKFYRGSGEISTFFIPWRILITPEFFGISSLKIRVYVTEVL